MNASVRANDEQNIDSNYIGGHAFGTQNIRGQWFRHWAVQHHVELAITQGNVPLNKTKQSKQSDNAFMNTTEMQQERGRWTGTAVTKEWQSGSNSHSTTIPNK